MTQTEALQKTVIEDLNATRDALDNAMFRIAGIGLPLAITFRGNLTGEAEALQWVFLVFFLSWASTVGIMVTAFWAGVKGFENTYAESLETGEVTRHESLERVTTMNHLAFASFVTGLLALVVMVVGHFFLVVP